MNWLTFALTTIVFYSLFDFFVKLTAGKIHDGLGVFLMNFVSTIVLLAYLVISKMRGEDIFLTKPGGVFYSIIAGVSISLAGIFFLKMFATGTNLSVGVPLVRIGIVLMASLLGVFVLKEGVNLKYIFGFLLSCLGLYLLTTAK